MRERIASFMVKRMAVEVVMLITEIITGNSTSAATTTTKMGTAAATGHLLHSPPNH
jgi:hypothetical protein